MPYAPKKSKLSMFGLQKILKRVWLFEEKNDSGYIISSTACAYYPHDK